MKSDMEQILTCGVIAGTIDQLFVALKAAGDLEPPAIRAYLDSDTCTLRPEYRNVIECILGVHAAMRGKKVTVTIEP
jgi:hypothetical protein